MPRAHKQAAPADPVAALVEAGLAARQAGRPELAALRFRDAVRLSPHASGLRAELAFTILQTGDLETSACEATAALELDPDHLGALATLGAVRLRQGRLEESAEHYARAARLAPDDAKLQMEAARPLARLGRAAEALDFLYRTLARDPLERDTLVEAARLHAESGRPALSVFLLRTAQAAHPGDLTLRARLAAQLVSAGMAPAAEAEAEAALAAMGEAASPDADAARELGRVFEALGKPRLAMAAIAHALEVDAQDVAALWLYGDCARRAGEATLAREALERLLALRPADVGARIALGVAQRETGDLAAAANSFEAALVTAPDHPEGLLELGMVRRIRGDHEGALALFLRLARSRRALGLVEAAAEHQALGRPVRARETLRAALKAEPNDRLALLRLAEFEVADGKDDVALAACAAAIAAHPDCVEAHGLQARLLIRLGRPQAALEAVDGLARRVAAGAALNAVRLQTARLAHDRQRVRSLLEASDADGAHFPLWWERVTSLLWLGDYEGATAAIAERPGQGAFEQARAAFLAGRCADLAWRNASAAEAYQRALTLYAHDPEANEHLARLACLAGDAGAAADHLRRYIDQAASGRSLRRLSLTPSQTLTGQLLNELVLDDGLRGRLVSIASLPAAERFEALRPVVLAAGEYTPPCLMLLLAARQAGRLEPGDDQTQGGSPIPRHIMQFNPYGRSDAALCAAVDSWPTRHPDFAYRCFDATGALAFLRHYFDPSVSRAFERVRSPEQASHLFRYAALAHWGGVFVGAEARCVGDLQATLRGRPRFVAFQEPHANLGTTILACPPGDERIGRALRAVVQGVERGDEDIPWLSAGPGLLSRLFAADLAAESPATTLQGVRILEQHDFEVLAALRPLPEGWPPD